MEEFDPEFAAWYRRQLARDRELALGLAGIVTGAGLMSPRSPRRWPGLWPARR